MSPPPAVHDGNGGEAVDASVRARDNVDSDMNVHTGESTRSPEFHPYPFYSPRFWHGMRPASFWRLLRQGRFKLSPSRIPLAIGVSLATPANTVLAGLQHLIFGRKLAASELHGAPVFIVGHWRSGTTLLHELMVMDERFSSPSTFQCFAPHHFLISEWFFARFARWLLPQKRPMDNMATGWDRPQEDEFALVNLGQPSPYRRIAFPNEGAVDLEYLNFSSDGEQHLSEQEIQVWMDHLRRFMLGVSYVTGRPLVIKSPTHTGRIAALAAAFPEAKFIHITRDPRSLFPSTCRLWRSLDEIQAFQHPHHEGIEQYVIECLQRMYHQFRTASDSIGPNRFIEIRYEDLAASPVSTLRSIYETLHLADFETVQPLIEAWVATEHKAYQTNRHQLDPAQEAKLKEAWSDYFQIFGYD